MDASTFPHKLTPPIDAKAHLPDLAVENFTLCGLPVAFRIMATAAQGDVDERAHIVVKLTNADGIRFSTVCQGCALRWLHSMLPVLSGRTVN